jgi:signal transduction histidine kinase
MKISTSQLELLNQAELLHKVRALLVEADALSSRISAVNEIGVTINRSLDLDAINRVVAKQAKWLMDFDYCSVLLYFNEHWQLKHLFGTPEEAVDNWFDTENVGKSLRHEQPQLIADGSSSPFMREYRSQLIIPLMADGVQLGTVQFASKSAQKYSANDMRIAYMLSLQMSGAIRNTNVLNELRATRDELKLRVEELDTYAHTIAHDLKSPLASLSLSAQIIIRKFGDELPSDALRHINNIYINTKQMNKMIDQLLWLAKLRDPQATMTRIAIKPIAETALARFMPQIEAQHIAVHVAHDLHEAIAVDQWVEEIFANLISNAIKYMGDNNPKPAIYITSKVLDQHVYYAVQDSGVGIMPENKATLFQMFTRFHTDKAEGIGLGLSIVRRMIHRMNGEIGVESVYGEGSTFWFTLPHA